MPYWTTIWNDFISMCGAPILPARTLSRKNCARQQSSSHAPAGAAELARCHKTERPSAPEEDHGPRPATLPASPRQLSFARQLATQIRGVGYAAFGSGRHGSLPSTASRAVERQASELIELLKQLRAGKVDLESALEDACC